MVCVEHVEVVRELVIVDVHPEVAQIQEQYLKLGSVLCVKNTQSVHHVFIPKVGVVPEFSRGHHQRIDEAAPVRGSQLELRYLRLKVFEVRKHLLRLALVLDVFKVLDRVTGRAALLIAVHG